MRVSTEQDELNLLVGEEQETKQPKKQSEKFQSFKKDISKNNLSSQKSSKQSKFLSFNDSGPMKVFPRSETTSIEDASHINLPLEHNDFTTFRRKSFTPPDNRSENPELELIVAQEKP